MRFREAVVSGLGLLCLVLCTLKGIGLLGWPWLWVVSPLWGPVALFGAILIFFSWVSVVCGVIDWLTGEY